MRTTVSGYRLEHRLHRNAGHEVWLARSPSRGEPVVVKRCSATADPRRPNSLLLEAQVLAALSHPNVVKLIGVVEDPSGPMLVVEPVSGGSLRDLLDERGTLTPGELVAVLHGVAAAVSHLADRDLVHGDIRPDHILLTAEGNPVLVGFGAATSALGAIDVPPIEAAWSDRGPDDPTYLHPPVAAGGSPGPRSEVFSLGVVAYECLTGRLPHRGTPAEVIALAAAGVHRSLSSWPSVPSGVAEVVEQALAPADTEDDVDVPVDAAAFVARLQAVVDPATFVRPRPHVNAAPTLLGTTADETLPFGPRPPTATVDARMRPEAWRVAAAVVIASVAAVTLWCLAGVALGV